MLELFTRLEREGESVLEEMLQQNTPESVDLEFKTKAERHRAGLNGDDKKHLGRALSAFANSAGGLLIFGACARTIDEVDRLVDLEPIPDIDRFASEVRTLCGQYLMPRHDGIRQTTVYKQDDQSQGYLAIYVERSERRPHQSKAPKDGRYYKRAGDSTFPMEHYDIEDAFNRKAVPILEFEASIAKVRPVAYGDGFLLLIALALRNNGEAPVRYPYMALEDVDTTIYQGGYEDEQPRWRYTRHSPGEQLTGGADDVIHMGRAQIAGFLHYSLTKDVNGRYYLHRRELGTAVIHGVVHFGAEGGRPEYQHFQVPTGDVIQAFKDAGYLPREWDAS